MAKELTQEQVKELDELFAKAQAALKIIETYDQARVDRLCQAVAWAISNKRTFDRLVDMGVEESGLGDPISRQNNALRSEAFSVCVEGKVWR
jgi:sulfoacetaldehyde dehydrogenase